MASSNWAKHGHHMALLKPLRSLFSSPSAGRAPASFQAHPDTPLVQLNPRDALRVRDFYEGIQIFGGTGSGKSSGSAKAIALGMLHAGWGGLCLCAKPGEADLWSSYIQEAGRTAHFIRPQPGSDWKINFPDYELHRPDGGGRETFNLVALMEVLMDATSQAQGPQAGGNGEAFWILSRRELLANAIEPLVAATGRFRLEDLMRMVTSAPRSRDEAYSDEWKANSFCYRTLRASFEAPRGSPLARHELQAAADYWFSTFASLDGKTRSNIVATLTSAISPFLRGVLHDSFSTHTTLIPEMTHEGAVIVWDFPIKTLGPAAVVAAQLMKYQWQKAAERRPVGPHTRPVFLFADECQFFLSEYDAEFQSTARSSRAATVYISQNLPTYYRALKGRDPKHSADSLLGNFQTKIFHANTDPTTNNFAAELIGKSLQDRASGNWSDSYSSQQGHGTNSSWGLQKGTSEGHSRGISSGTTSSSSSNGQWSVGSSSGMTSGSNSGWSRSTSVGGGHSENNSESWGFNAGGGWSQQMDFTVQPSFFAYGLRKGGQADRFLVDALVVQGGRNFAINGRHWLACTFRQ